MRSEDQPKTRGCTVQAVDKRPVQMLVYTHALAKVKGMCS